MITKCKDCQAAEVIKCEPYFLCHRKSGKPVEVSLDHWCCDGIPVYGDKPNEQ